MLPKVCGPKRETQIKDKLFKVWGDGSFALVQRNFPTSTLALAFKFGPLDCTLADLVDKGFILRVDGFTKHHGLSYNRKHKLRLVNPATGDSYIVAKVYLADLMSEDTCLTDFVRDGIQMIKRGSCASSVKEVATPVDPWEVLMDHYPKPSPKPTFFGNMTPLEYVQSTLRNPERINYHV